jgi:uncharacterized Rmd1/YagE family protein
MQTVSHPIAAAGQTVIKSRALLLGERIDLRALSSVERLAPDPLTVAAGANGIAVLFRYGAVVFFNVGPLEENALLRQLQPLIQGPYANPETESITLTVDPSVREGRETATSDTVYLADYALERFQLVAAILSKSTVLSMYEARVTKSFEMIEPFAAELERESQSGRKARDMLRHIGTALLSEHNMVGRVEVIDKPEIILEHPDLERFYLRLDEEFDIRDRHLTLERKLNLVSRTAHTALEVLQDRRNLRVEWYIVILIVVEIALTVYQMFVIK